MTPKTREQLSQLIEQIDGLESLAKSIQAPDAEQPEELARSLEQQYRAWYAKCLPLLPEDLRTEFKAAYDGTWLKTGVKNFIGNPLEANILYKEPKPGEAKIFDPLAHPFDTAFRDPINDQKQALLNAHERLGGSSDLV